MCVDGRVGGRHRRSPPGTVGERRDRARMRVSHIAPVSGLTAWCPLGQMRPSSVTWSRSDSRRSTRRRCARGRSRRSRGPRRSTSRHRRWCTGNEEMRPSGTPYSPLDDDRHRDPVVLRRAEEPVAGGVDRRGGGRRGRGRAAGVDDRGTALGDGRDEVVLDPGLVADELGGVLALDLGVEEVGVLGRRVVAPDRHLLDVGDAARRSWPRAARSRGCGRGGSARRSARAGCRGRWSSR